jgi:hypothetical protein
LLSYDRLSRKPLFKEFTGLTVKGLMTFAIRGYQKDTAGMRSDDYPKEMMEGNDPWVLGDVSSWM